MTTMPAASDPPLRVYPAKADHVEGWLVLDTVSNDLAFGGFRFGPGVTEQEVRGLARAMSWKLGIHGQPVGGAKAGLRCDPTDPALPALLGEIARQWSDALGKVAIVGKDMGASDFLLDTLYEGLGTPQLGLVQRRHPSCPPRIRDMTGYVPHMTGRGVAVATRAALGGNAEGRRVIIQGAGRVGIGSAYRLDAMGARIVAISDVDGAIVSQDGLPVATLLSARDAQGRIDRSLLDFPHEQIHRDELLHLDADILILAAGSLLVGEHAAQRVRVPLVVEGANLGLTEEARTVLAAAQKTVIPDIIASSSSAALVGLQAASGNQITSDALWEQIESAIDRAVRSGMEVASRDGCTVREATLRHYNRP